MSTEQPETPGRSIIRGMDGELYELVISGDAEVIPGDPPEDQAAGCDDTPPDTPAALDELATRKEHP